MRVSNVRKGIELALANALVLAGGFAYFVPSPRRAYAIDAIIVWFAGALVAVPCGALMGALAGWLRRARGITMLAASFVLLVGACAIGLPAFAVDDPGWCTELIALAWVPTSFATLVLEAWTRPDELPAARVIADRRP